MRRNFVGRGRGYSSGSNPDRPVNRTPIVNDQYAWTEIIGYLNSDEVAKTIRKNICIGCFMAVLFNNRGERFFVNGRLSTLEGVKAMVANIARQNSENGGS